MAIDPDVQILLDDINARLDAATPVVPTGGDDWPMLTALHDTLAVQAAPGVMRLEGEFHLSQDLVITGCHVDAPWAVFRGAGITIGTTAQSCDRKVLNLPFVISDEPDPLLWTGTGITFAAADACIGSLASYGYDQALLFSGADGQGVAYNKFDIRQLSGKTPLTFDRPGTGWANQNTLVGGRFFTVDDTRMVQSTGCNGITIIGASFEGNDIDYMVDLLDSPWWRFTACRWEGTNPKARFVNSPGWKIDGGPYADQVLIEESPWSACF